MEFENLEQFRDSWKQGTFDYEEKITIAGIPYHRRGGESVKFEDVLLRGMRGHIIYATQTSNRQAAKEAGLNRWIVLLWGCNDGMVIRPYDLRAIQPERFFVESTQERIGDIVILKIMLPSGAGALKGKVDTGADVCSLHAENIQIVGDMVKFVSPELSRNELSLPVAQYHAVKSADGGTVNRPVVELDIEINGVSVRRAQFNLNDRSQMEHPVLIGQNVLEKTNFLIDPNQDGVHEDMEWNEDVELTTEMIEATFEDAVPYIAEKVEDKEKLQNVYNVLKESDVSLQELIQYIRVEARTVMEEIDY